MEMVKLNENKWEYDYISIFLEFLYAFVHLIAFNIFSARETFFFPQDFVIFGTYLF